MRQQIDYTLFIPYTYQRWMEAPFKLHQQTDQFTPNPDINATYWSVQADLLADIIDS